MIAHLRKRLFRKPMAPRQPMEGKAVIVTGCAENSIGYATAKALLEWGAEVTVTRRADTLSVVHELEKDVPAARGRIYGRDLDLAEAQSVQHFADWYFAERKTLDVLINNAGIHLDLLSKWKKPTLSKDQQEIQWRTNYLGTIHLTHALLPLLMSSAESSGDARVVNVMSMLHSRGRNSEFFEPTRPYNSWEAYGQSKLGILHFTRSLQEYFSEQGLSAYCLHPGEVYTNIAGKGLAGNPGVEALRNFFWPLEKFLMMTPEEGAQTSLLCATSPSVEGGKYYRNCRVAQASPDAEDAAMRRELWGYNQAWLATLQQDGCR